GVPGLPDVGPGGSRFGAHVYLWATDASVPALDRAIGEAARVGLDFVQLSLSSPSLDVGAVRESLVRHGMSCLTGLAIPGSVWSDRRHGAVRRYLRWAVDATAELGAGMLSGALYTPMGERGAPPARGASPDRARAEAGCSIRLRSGRSVGPGAPEPLRDLAHQHL